MWDNCEQLSYNARPRWTTPGAVRGATRIPWDEAHFRWFLAESAPHDFGLMLEVKDKEWGALRALEILVSLRLGV